MRRTPAFFAVALALPALAGCLADDAATPAAAPPAPVPDLPALLFSKPLSIDAAHPSAEPSIRVAPDGTVWITAPDGLGSGDHVWRSRDGGAKFEYMGKPDPVFGGGDSDLAVGSSGRLWQTGLWLGCVSAATSTDGASWSMNPLVCGYPVDDRQWIEAAGDDEAYLTFGSGVGPLAQIVLGKLGVENGLPVLRSFIALDDSAEYQWPGSLDVDARSGNVYVAYLTTDDKAYVYRSTDGGATATRHLVAERKGDTFDSFGVVQVDGAGHVYYAWSERDPENKTTGVWLAASQDAGEHWSAPVRVNQAPATAIFPWIAAGDAGRVAVAYYGTNATGESAEEVDGEWHVWVSQTGDALPAAPAWNEARASEAPIIKGSICTSGTGCARGTRDLLDFFQVAAAPDGSVHLAWAGKPSADAPAVVLYGKQVAGPTLLGAAPAAPAAP